MRFRPFRLFLFLSNLNYQTKSPLSLSAQCIRCICPHKSRSKLFTWARTSANKTNKPNWESFVSGAYTDSFVRFAGTRNSPSKTYNIQHNDEHTSNVLGSFLYPLPEVHNPTRTTKTWAQKVQTYNVHVRFDTETILCHMLCCAIQIGSLFKWLDCVQFRWVRLRKQIMITDCIRMYIMLNYIIYKWLNCYIVNVNVSDFSVRL